jgi:4-hydroxymandelate oxidase
MVLNIDEMEATARACLPREIYDYYAGAAWDAVTLRENRAAYARLAIHYRVLRDVSLRSMECELLGSRLAMPILAAPTAFHCLASTEGEVATARGVGAAGTLMVLSSLATRRLEDVAVAATGPLWFQLYINKDRGFTRELVARARAAGYRALVVTADTPCWGVRENDLRNGFHLPEGIEPVNLMLAGVPGGTDRTHHGAGMAQILSWMLDPALTWRDIEWLSVESGMPVLVKGVCRPEDAREALARGAAGVIVSNHGGRQLDSAPATISVLPEIAEAVAGAAPVLVDGGIRRGTDVLKALALGARAVLVGRPVLWGLATGGADGVAQALRMLQHELDLAMALAGCASLAGITPDLVRSSS